MTTKDIISKDLLKRLAYDLATYLFELDVTEDQIDLLDTQSQRIEERRADLVVRMRDRQTGKTFLLHIEIQNQHDPLITERMLRYLSDIKLTWPGEPVLQYLIYIGNNPLRMSNGFDELNHSYHFHILDMKTIDCDHLISLDKPDALVLAILCDFKDKSAEVVVESIIFRLHELLQDQDKEFRNYLKMLEILSENRQLQDIVERGEQMLTQINEENLPSFRIGMRKGLLKGQTEGKIQGKIEGKVDMLKELILEKFGDFPAWAEQRLLQMTEAELDGLVRKILKADEVRDLFE